MFKKLKLKRRTDIYVDVMCVEMIIDMVTSIDRKLTRSEEIIDSLKHDKDAILFNNLLNLVGDIEDQLEHLNGDSTYTGTKKYIDTATDRLKKVKKDIQMILYETKFG